MSKVMRSVRNVTKGYSSVQVKVREATSNDPWGPTGTQMSEIANMTFSSNNDFYEIMDMLDKRLNDKGKNWRHVLKALKVMDYCLHEGSELVVTWAKQNIFIIKTLREFQYIDEEGKDVGQNVRVAAKELSALLADEERLRAERADRRNWKSRVHGLNEDGPPGGSTSQSQQHDQPRRQPRRQYHDEDDAEYRLAIEASKAQEEEDRRKRASRNPDDDDDDLAKAIKLSQEEEERRRRELEDSNASALFDDAPTQSSQPQFTGLNQGYQQGSAVDFFANPIEQQQVQPQPTAYLGAAYPGFQTHPTGYQNSYRNGFGAQPTGFDPYGQQQLAQQQLAQQQLAQQQLAQQQQMTQAAFQPQPTGYNPYAQQQQQQQQQQQMQQPQFQQSQGQDLLQPGSNNPWAGGSLQAGAMKPMATGSNNPFAQQQPQQQQQSAFGRPQAFKAPSMPSLGSLPEQKTLTSFPQAQSYQSPSPQPVPQVQLQPQRELNEHEAKLNALLASGDGMDTFGNTGNLRIPAQHTAPGTFVNSAGAGVNRLTADATGSNPFLRTQFTGMPNVSYGAQQMPAATGPAGMAGYGGGQQGTNNPFAGRQGQQQQQGGQGQGDLIQF